MGQIWRFCLYGIGKCFELTRTFILDKTIGGNITFFHFLIFCIFAKIIIFIMVYMKQVEITIGENDNEWEKEKRYKK